MINEFIFTIHCFVCAAGSVVALLLGPYALCSIIAFQCVLSNLLVLKQAVIFGFTATCADPFTIGATFLYHNYLRACVLSACICGYNA